MPRPKKYQTKNALECPDCFKMCKSESGLTQHYNRIHSHVKYIPKSSSSESFPDIQVLPLDGIPPDIIGEVDENENNLKKSFDASGIFLDSNKISDEMVSVIDLSENSANNSGYNPDDISDAEYNPDDTSDDGNSSVNSDEALDFVNIDCEKFEHFPNLIQHNEILPHHRAGYIYQTEGTGSQVFEVQKNLQIKHGHPFFPWANEDEFWLAYFMFVKARMSISTSNSLLDGFKNGRITMQSGLSYHTNRKMLELIDKAQFITVCKGILKCFKIILYIF
jgi:hypothetical protein